MSCRERMKDEMSTSALRNLFQSGVRSAEDSTTRRKVLLCNVGAFVGICSLLLYDSIFLYSGSPSARLAAFSHIPFYAGFASIFWLNRKSHYVSATWLLVLCAMAANYLPMLIAFGTYLAHHHYFILFAVVPIAILSASRWPTVAFLFIINSALFIWFSLYGMAPAPDILSIDRSVVITFRTLLSFMVILTLAIFYWAYDIFAGKSERELQMLSMTDSLTQLPNRRYFENAFRQEVARAERSGTPIAIAYMDIDRFKSVNDNYGHNMGDAVIRHVADVVRQNLRAGSTVGRLGGDELVVLMPNANEDDACEAMERVRTAVESTPCKYAGKQLSATVSIGVAQVDIRAEMTDAYRNADELLYEAKSAGRNVVKRRAA